MRLNEDKSIQTILAFVVIITTGIIASGQPVDNPVAGRYGTDAYPWAAQIKWNTVYNIINYPGTTMIARFNAARDAAAAAGGGVVYFPAGEYRFEDTIYLKSGVVLRGETPSITDAKNSAFLPVSKLVFPEYKPTFSGNGTDNSTAFKPILVADPDNACNLGLVFLDVNRAAIQINASASAKNGNIIIYGVRSNNVALPDPGVPCDFQQKWQRFSYRFAYNISGYSYKNFLIANNRINDAPSDNYDQPGYVLMDGTTPLAMTDGTRVPFNYTNHYGISINRVHSDANVDVTTHPTSFRKGIVIRDNWIFCSMRVKLICSGYGLAVKDNIFKDQPGKTAWADPTGKKLVGNANTLENRAIDFAGWDVLIEGNQYEVYRHRLKDGGYFSVDGEGILIQELCGGTRVNGLTIRNNTGNTYVGLYKMPIIRDVLITGNTATDGGIMVSADYNAGGGWMEKVVIEKNTISGDIQALASKGGTGNFVQNNICSKSATLITTDNVTLSANTGFTIKTPVAASQTLRYPTISIVTPKDESAIALTATMVAVSAADDGGRIDSVVYFADGERLGVSSATPFSFPWVPRSPGPWYLTARAYNNSGSWFSAKPAYVTAGNGSTIKNYQKHATEESGSSVFLRGTTCVLPDGFNAATISIYSYQGKLIGRSFPKTNTGRCNLKSISGSSMGSKIVVVRSNDRQQVLRLNEVR